MLNADDPLVAAVARRVRSRVAYFSMDPDRSPVLARHRRAGGRAWVLRRDRLVEWDGTTSTSWSTSRTCRSRSAGSPATTSRTRSPRRAGRAASGATREQVADGLRDFRPSAELSPGRLNLFRLGRRTVIIDFAHNEAGTTAILDVAAGIAGGAAGRAAPITAIIGTAGDRPDDTLRGIGRIAAAEARRVAIKETLGYLRGREREDVVRMILEGVAEGGRDPDA